MSLFDLHREYDQPPARATKQDEPGFVATIKNTRSGVPIMVCNIDQPPQAAIDRASVADVPLFVAREIELMRDLDPTTLDAIITAKRVFFGCDIKDIIRGAI